MNPPTCRICKKSEWRHVCKGQPKLPELRKTAIRSKPIAGKGAKVKLVKE